MESVENDISDMMEIEEWAQSWTGVKGQNIRKSG